MERKPVLIAVVVGVLLAGCTTSEVPNTGTPETQSSIETSVVNSTTPSSSSQLEIPSCPNLPHSFTQKGVAEFATQFEQARETRLALADTSEEVTELRVRTNNPNVTKTKDGWIVHFMTMGPYMRWNTTDPDAPDHADPGLYTANYFITTETIRRTQATEVIDPRENGTTVECPPDE